MNEKSPRTLSDAEIQDAQIGLDKWHIEKLEEEKRILDLEQGLYKEHIKYLQEEHGNDPLTGVLTRKAFLAELDKVFVHPRKETEGTERRHSIEDISLVFIDLDHFKEVNDGEGGHAKGDEVLKKAATLLHSALREGDVIGRLGGDEFVVLLPNTNEHDAAHVAEKLRGALDDNPDLGKLHVTGSIGVCSSSTSKATTPEELIAYADAAMYVAKDAGRNQVSVYKRP